MWEEDSREIFIKIKKDIMSVARRTLGSKENAPEFNESEEATNNTFHLELSIFVE